MYLFVILYNLFSACLSMFLAWHFPVPNYVFYMLWGLFFLSFNTFFVFIRFPYHAIHPKKILLIICSVLLAFVSYLTIFCILNDFLLFIPSYASLFFSHQNIFLSLMTLAGLATGIYALWNANRMTVTSYHLTTRKKVNVTIAFISDLHITPFHMSANKIKQILDILQQHRPDYTVLGGDVIEMRPDYFTENAIIHAFQKFNTCNTILGVVGNHEYYGGQIHENILAMEQAGIIVLKDAVRFEKEHNIVFIGRDDKINPYRLPLKRLLQNIKPTQYCIVLDHDPSSIPETVQSGADLQLSGHTHGGQIFPFNILVKFMFENAYGHKHIKNSDTIVSSGAGIWGPKLRIGTKNEIVLIHIHQNQR